MPGLTKKYAGGILLLLVLQISELSAFFLWEFPQLWVQGLNPVGERSAESRHKKNVSPQQPTNPSTWCDHKKHKKMNFGNIKRNIVIIFKEFS